MYGKLPRLEEEQIRLISVEPAREAADDIECSLSIVSLKNPFTFTALSYTWGAPYAAYDTKQSTLAGVDSEHFPQSRRRRRIICDGREICVGDNLRDFLVRCSQNPDPLWSGPWWIDAISIDQNNVSERSHQVNLMAEIYKSATRVVVWLGEEEEQTFRAGQLIAALAELRLEEQLRLHPHQIRRNSADVLTSHEHWVALATFFERKWFHRAWIIQEVILAKSIDVVCGSTTLSWHSLTRVSAFLATSNWTHEFNTRLQLDSASAMDRQPRYHGMPARLNAAQRTWRSQTDHGLLFALIRARHSASSDPRDKVYSQLSLANSDLFPDYERQVSAVYIETAVSILHQSKDLFLLTCVEGQEFQTIQGLPSWVPDWSERREIGLRVTGYLTFDASSGRSQDMSLKSYGNSHLLRVQAARLDTVKHSGHTKEQIHAFSDPEMFWSLLSKIPKVYHTGEPREEVVWRTLITDRDRHAGVVQHPASATLEPSFRAWILWRYSLAPKPAQRHNLLSGFFGTNQSPIIPSVEEILDATGQDSHHKEGDICDSIAHKAAAYDSYYLHAMLLRPFVTSTGFFGLGTQALQEGDSVWALPGCRVPLILRKSADESRYRLVGGAYVHGFMHGEAFLRDDVELESMELE